MHNQSYLGMRAFKEMKASLEVIQEFLFFQLPETVMDAKQTGKWYNSKNKYVNDRCSA